VFTASGDAGYFRFMHVYEEFQNIKYFRRKYDQLVEKMVRSRRETCARHG